MKNNPMGITKNYKGYDILFLDKLHMYEVHKNGQYKFCKPTLQMVKDTIDGVTTQVMKQAKMETACKMNPKRLKKNTPYGYGKEYDNPMKQDDMSRALHTINYTFNTVDKHVSIGGEGGMFNVYVTDLGTDDIIRTWGPINKDAVTYILLGMLETIKIVRYE